MTPAELEAIKERRRKITEPPWVWESVGQKCTCIVIGTTEPRRSGAFSEEDYYNDETGEYAKDRPMRVEEIACIEDSAVDPHENADFIAHAPTDIDALVGEVERLKSLLREAREEAKEARRSGGMWDYGLTPTDEDWK